MTNRDLNQENFDVRRSPEDGQSIARPRVAADETAIKDEDTASLVRILVICEQGLFRQGLLHILDAQADFTVVADASGGMEAVIAARRGKPDIILFCTESSGVKIGEEVRNLRVVAPRAKVIVLAAHDEPRRVKHVLSAGAHAYVMKSASQEELVTTIRVVDRHSDRVMLSVSRSTVNTLKGSQSLLLSERELEVLALVADGMRNSQIAAKLFITEGTVKRHLTNIYAKLGATSRTDAMRKASAQGIGL